MPSRRAVRSVGLPPSAPDLRRAKRGGYSTVRVGQTHTYVAQNAKLVRFCQDRVRGNPVETHSPIRVVVGEDQPLFREGLVHILREAEFDVVASAGDARDLVRKARAHTPDVAVVDIHMPPQFEDDGLVAAKEIRASVPTVGILVLSHLLDDRYAVDLLGDKPEGVGYLLKDRVTDVAMLADAVTTVARGGSVVDPQVVGLLVGRRRKRDPVDDMTPRERDVLALMAQGKTNQGIADSLVVSVSAVERHVTGIFVKLGLGEAYDGHRRVRAVLCYLRR
jgi:DNA-binding NarL/FixJ family response regulator